MAVQTITYTNKQYLNENPSIANINKVTDDDMNMIKSVVNNNATETSNNTIAITNLTSVSLYDNSNGDTGNIQISDSAANYTFLEIHFKDENGTYSSTKVYQPNGKTVNLISTKIESGKISFYSKNVSISTTNITNVNAYVIIFDRSTFGGYNNNPAVIAITKVIGYK